MLASAGFAPRERGTVTVINEWPDAGLAVRALAAAGPSVPAIQAAGLGPFCQALRDVIEPLRTPVPGSGSLRSSAGSPPNSDPLTPYLSAFAGPARPVSSPTPDVPRSAAVLDHRM